MKPITLKISAFGPFKDEIVIDFNKLYESKIFLITGDTGSGKTTIFDAICYSLYNDTSGENRQIEFLRSDYTKPDVNTFVELEFSHKGKNYIVYRSPSYLKPGRKTKTISEASLKYDDVIIEGTKQVNEKINDILKIDIKQFKQISMLAQGEFLKLLLADSNERSKIFRKIFDTTIYNNLSEKLKCRFLTIKKNYEESKIRLDNEISHIKWINDVDTSNMLIEEIINDLKRIIENDEIDVNKLEEENKKLIDQSEKINSFITIADIDNKNILELNKYNEKFNNLKNKLTYYDNLKIDIDINKILIPIYQNMNKINKILTENENNLININKDLNNLKTNFANIEKEYLKVDDYKLKLNDLNILKENLLKNEKINKAIVENEKFINDNPVDDISKIKNEIKQLTDNITNDNSIFILEEAKKTKEINDKKINDLKNTINDIKNLEEKLKNDLIIADKLIIDSNNKSKKYNDMESCFLKNQAGILASNLEDNKPCMVCGSLNHPCKAKITNSNYSKEELELFKKELDNIIERRNFLLNDINCTKALISEKNKEKTLDDLQKLKNNIIDIDLLNSNVQKLEMQKQKLENITNYYNKTNNLIQEIDIKKSNINLLKKSLFITNYSFNDINKHIKELTYKINDITNNYNEIINNKNIKLKEKEILTNNIKDNTKELNRLEKEFNKINYNKKLYTMEECYELEKEYYKYYEEYNITKEFKKELENKTINKNFIDIEEYKIKYINLKKQIEDNNKNEKNIRLKNNIEILSNIEKLYKKNKDILKNYSLYKRLSDTANGNIVGKNKILFEQFVQTSYFSEIIKKSNYRLDIMTSGRYELLKKNNSSNLKDKVGLDLEVMDNYTGKIRDVKSLSGGESFKASLSLALGLSDTIQNYSGGIVVDTMFIDEGFGSLDNDSLEQALRTLSDLSSGNCIIGIISHVTELKERIDKKIIVSKSNTGSTIKIEG